MLVQNRQNPLERRTPNSSRTRKSQNSKLSECLQKKQISQKSCLNRENRWKWLTWCRLIFIPRGTSTITSAPEEGDRVFKETISNLDSENCYKTASSYYKIAYRDIKILHFAEDSVAYKNYFFTTHPVFREVKMYLWWIYMLLTFFEPNHSNDSSILRSSPEFLCVMVIEVFILGYFIIDMILRIYYMYSACKRLGFWKVFLDDIFFVHFLCELAMIFDCIIFYSVYPRAYFRFGRIFRAIKAVLESKEVYRTTMSTLNCLPQIIDLALLIMIVSFLYAVFGIRFLDPETPGITVSILMTI